MKKVAIVVGIVLALLAVVGVGVDRAAAAVVERTVSERIAAELGGSGETVAE